MRVAPAGPLLALIVLLGWPQTGKTAGAQARLASQLPGLYGPTQPWIKPVQGYYHFQRLLLEPSNTKLTLVQFYMATCPDCQGFAPYFSRLVADLGPHWWRILRVLVVNCNEQANLRVCWDENPRLVVPLLRWYTLSSILADARRPQTNKTLTGPNASYPARLLSISHRELIPHQRRDHISLRDATLNMMASILDSLQEARNQLEGPGVPQHPTGASLASLASLLDRLPAAWLHMAPLGQSKHLQRQQLSRSAWSNELLERLRHCARLAGLNQRASLSAFLLYSRGPEGLLAGRTFVADWSNYSCLPDTNSTFMFAFSSEPLLSPDLNLTSQPEQPQLYLLNLNSDQLEMLEPAQLAYRLEPIPLSFTASTLTIPTNSSLQQAALNWYQAENINWAPEVLHPGQEALRLALNLLIGQRMNPPMFEQQVPGLRPEQLGEIRFNRSDSTHSKPVTAKDEHLTLVKLTDYYRVLDEILHKSLISKADLDGLQLMSINCLLRQLIHLFPFQGAHLIPPANSQSRIYLELTNQKLGHYITQAIQPNQSAFNYPPTSFYLCSGYENMWLNSSSLKSQLIQFHRPVSDLLKIQSLVQSELRVGQPQGQQFKWSYCAGSEPYLRGHTCALWLLFHTMTVHEYLMSMGGNASASYELNSGAQTEPKQYKFRVSKIPLNYYSDGLDCDPKNPEAALLNSNSSQLLVGETKFALANIINFVRFFLPCTNCAAHFSCMVARSSLNFVNPEPTDHLLWLWEAHNHVNLRTKNTHSEDPMHPKYVFPDYEACPSCFLEKPGSEPTELESLKFNHHELVNFLVTRYRREFILNNRIKIENHFWKIS